MVHRTYVGADDGWVKTVEDVAVALLERVDELADLAMKHYAQASPDGYDPVPEEELRTSARESLRLVLALLAGRDPSTLTSWSPYEIGRRRAEQGVPLESILRLSQLDGRLLWEHLGSALSSASAELLVTAGTRVWDVVDATVRDVVDGYNRAQLELARFDLERRGALLDELLRPVDPARTARVGRRLDLPEVGTYVVIVMSHSGSSPPAPEHELRSARIRSLWRAGAERSVGVALLPDPAALKRIVRSLQDAGAGAGISPVVPSLLHIPRALHLAEVALRSVSGGQVVTADDQLLGALAAADPVVADHLVERVLGPLLRADGARDRLLRTLQSWVRQGGSVDDVADELFVHRNTVRNHLATVEELTGRSLRRPQDTAELVAALAALPVRPV